MDFSSANNKESLQYRRSVPDRRPYEFANSSSPNRRDLNLNRRKQREQESYSVVSVTSCSFKSNSSSRCACKALSITMRSPTREDCQPENCETNEQQFARICRLWLSDPDGRFDARQTNRQRLCSSLEYRFQPWFSLSPEKTIHEFWSDGIYFLETSGDGADFEFVGASIFSDREAMKMWLAPFEIAVTYPNDEIEQPAALRIKFGVHDSEQLIARIQPKSWKTWREEAVDLLSPWPTDDCDWAIVLESDSFPEGFRDPRVSE